MFVVGPIAGKKHQELIFPVVAPDPEKDSDVKYLTYPFYAGGNRGRGQVYPTGETAQKATNSPRRAPKRPGIRVAALARHSKSE